MLGSVAYRGWLSRRSVVTTAGRRTAMVSEPPSFCEETEQTVRADTCQSRKPERLSELVQRCLL